jgi:hypothetical protein
MSGRIGYNGMVQPAIWFDFMLTKGAGSRHAFANHFFQVENEALFDFTLVAKTPKGVFRLERHATKKRRLFDGELNTYIAEPISASALNAIFDANEPFDAKTLQLFLTVKIWFKPFFYEMLKFLTRDTGDTFNLARPDAQGASDVESSFTHVRRGERATITHPDQQREIKDIPCELHAWDIRPASKSGKPPTVKLRVFMKIHGGLAKPDEEEVARIFMAADYTKLYKFGLNTRSKPWFESLATAPTGIERSLKTWELNVTNYLWLKANFNRGDKIRQEIMALATAGMAKPQLEVVQIIRDAIDARLVTANHWGDLREDWITERYQRKLSDLFGAIHQNQWYASPVRLIRDMTDTRFQKAFFGLEDPVPDDDKAALILQYGTGHCGEHTDVSFSICRSLMDAGNQAKFVNIVYTGNANVDHAFVVGGFRVSEVIETLRTHPFNGKVGDAVDVWDLRAMLAQNPGKDGFVLDPYLAPTRQARTAKELLARLNSRERGAKRTDCLWFGGQFGPGPAETRVNKLNIRGV